MLIKSTRIQGQNDLHYFIEAIYNSSNILKTTYFPHNQRLYISFNRGGTYSYGNINEELYNKFENADSQGEFFLENIKTKQEEFPFRKEFTLYPSEIQENKDVIEKKKEEIQMAENELINDGDEDIIEIAKKIYQKTYGQSFNNVYLTDPKYLSLLEAVKQGYLFCYGEKNLQELKNVDSNEKQNYEELFNTVELCKRVLKFYADDDNYENNNNENINNDDEELFCSYVKIDNGYQAKFVINTIEKLEAERKKMFEDLKNGNSYDEINNLKKTYKGLMEE